VTLKAAVIEQAPRYATIKAPVVVIAGDADKTVWPTIHSQPFAAIVPNAKLILLPGVGHMVMYAERDLVMHEIDVMTREVAHSVVAAD
jgi:pimeloyl-ACP methyl ester carboxylesterase